MLRGKEEAQFLSLEHILKKVDLLELEGEKRGKQARYMAGANFQGGHCHCKRHWGRVRASVRS